MKRSILVAALVALAVAPAFASPTDDVRSSMLRLAGLSSYQMSFGSGKQSGTMEVVKPDGMRMKSGAMEMVRVGTATYVKMPGQNWMKLPSSHGGPMGTEIAAKVRELAATPKGLTVADLGMKSVDGESMHAYHVAQNDGTQSTVYIARDGMIHRMDSAGTGTAQTVRFSKFNSVAPIRAPI